MSSIDRRVVEMEFDNKQFQAGIKDTLGALDQLKKGLNLEGTTKGLKGLDGVGKGMGLENISSALDNISSRFSAMGAIGFAVIQRLTNAAIDFGKNLANKVLDPLVQGGKRRALNIEQAKFQFRGLGMDVEETMASALAAVTGTAYGLDEAARAAGQFGASGMRAGDDMTSALRAISGVAAMTNSSYEDIANVFTKVAGNGRVMGDDLLRMSSRGLNAAATLADSLGISEAAVREMVTDGKVSFEMFYEAMDDAFGENATKANETYTGSLANMRAALARIGANFFTPWLEQQRDLFNALSPAIDAVGGALKPVIKSLTHFTGRGTKGLIKTINAFDFSRLSLVFQPITAIVKNLYQAVKAFLIPVREAFRQIFPPKSLEEINGMLKTFQKFTAGLKMEGGRLYDLQRVFAGFFAILGIGWEVVKAGTRFLLDLFGVVSKGSGGFLEGAANVGDFFVSLHEAVKNGEGLTNFFEGLTKILTKPIEMLGKVAKFLRELFDFEAPSSERLSEAFEPLGRIGEVIVNLWMIVVGTVKSAWSKLQPIVQAMGNFFGKVGDWLGEAFKNFEVADILDMFKTGFLGGLLVVFNRFTKDMGSGMGGAIYKMTSPFQKLTFTLNTMQTTLRAMTLMQIAIAVGVLTMSVNTLSKIDAAGLTRALSAITVMFTQLMAGMAVFTRIGGVPKLVATGAGLILFATAIRVLTSSVKALSGLEWEELGKGLAGVAALVTTLVAATRGLAGQSKGMIKAGAGLLILATAIRVLVKAVTTLSGLSWEEMGRGLLGVGALLASLAIFTRMVAANKAGVLQGAGLLLLATGIRILANAVVIFANLSVKQIVKGLGAVAGILTAFAIFSHAVKPAGIVRTGVALVLVGAAMNILARAMKQFGGMEWEEIGKGLTAMAGALVAIAISMHMMPKNILANSIALIGVATAITILSGALRSMGGMSWEEIAKGLVTLAGSLIIIAVAMKAMTTALPGAAALFVIASALRIFAPVLKTFASMSIAEIATSLGMLAGVFVVLGLAALVLTPLVPVLLGLGAAIALIGLGVSLAAAGVMLFAVSLTALAAAGTAGAAAFVGLVNSLLRLLPVFAEQLGLALIAFGEVIATAGPTIVRVLTTVIDSMLTVVNSKLPDILKLVQRFVTMFLKLLVDLIPKVADAALKIVLGILRAMVDNIPKIVREITNLVVAILRELTRAVPRMVRAAVDLMVAFLGGIERNVGRIIAAGTNVIIALIEGIGRNAIRLARAAAETLVAFLNGLSTAINRYAPQIRKAGRSVAFAMVDGITGGLAGKVGEVAGKAREMANSAVSAVKGVFKSKSPSKVFMDIGRDVGDGLAIGLERSGAVVSAAATDIGEDTIDAMKQTLTDISNLAASDIDLNPTITPVVDLSDFRKDVAQIDSSFKTRRPIDVDVAFTRAKDIMKRRAMEDVARQRLGDEAVDNRQALAGVIFNQNNYSPKALTPAEVYRQTKNQLSTAKGALTP